MNNKTNLIIFTVIIIFLLVCSYCVKEFYYIYVDENYEKYMKELELKCVIETNSVDSTKLNLFNQEEKSKFELKFLTIISNLRWYEQEIINNKKNIDKTNCIKNLKIIYECYKIITSKVNDYFLSMHNYLEELNDRITFYYRFINQNNLFNFNYKNNTIKVFKISKHHHAIEWIYKNIKNSIGTILHIDSHADMNPIGNDLNFFEKCINDNNFETDNLKRIYQNVNAIGTVLVPMVAPYKINNGIIWLTPDWVKEPFCQSNNKITTTWNNCFFKGKCPNYYPIKDVPGMNKVIFNEEDRDIKISTSNIKYINKLEDSISNDYILNIDLDYFVTYGEDNYLPGGVDAVSSNRSILDFGFLKKNSLGYMKASSSIGLEVNLIRKRIDEFLKLIIRLKEKGKIPKIVIICDSTNVDFTNDQLGQEFMSDDPTGLTNEFTPKYLTFWLNNTIHTHLEQIFTN